MGIHYDDLAILGKWRKRLACAAGHPQREFQTKGFDGRCLRVLILIDGRIWYDGPPSLAVWAGDDIESVRPVRGYVERVVVHRSSDLTPIVLGIDGRRRDALRAVSVYTSCEKCPAVWAVLKRDERKGQAAPRPSSYRPWIEYLLMLDRNARVVDVKPIRVETAATVRRRLERDRAWRIVPEPEWMRTPKSQKARK